MRYVIIFSQTVDEQKFDAFLNTLSFAAYSVIASDVIGLPPATQEALRLPVTRVPGMLVTVTVIELPTLKTQQLVDDFLAESLAGLTVFRDTEAARVLQHLQKLLMTREDFISRTEALQKRLEAYL